MGATPPASGLQASFEDLGYELPAGYIEQRTDAVAIFAPSAASDQTPCLYGLAGRAPSTGNLEADAESALIKTVVPGWRRLDDRHAAMRGTSPSGWPYAWYRAAFEGNFGGTQQPVNAMAMVLPAGGSRNHIVWGMGSIARCLLDDASFEQLFHGLRPAGWASDGGQAMTRSLQGQWRFTAGSGIQQLTFKDGGRYRSRSRQPRTRRRRRADGGHGHRRPVLAERRPARTYARSSPRQSRSLLRPCVRRMVPGRLEAVARPSRQPRRAAAGGAVPTGSNPDDRPPSRLPTVGERVRHTGPEDRAGRLLPLGRKAENPSQ